MIKRPYATKPNKRANDGSATSIPCVVCGIPIDTRRLHHVVIVHGGGAIIVTEAEQAALNRRDPDAEAQAKALGGSGGGEGGDLAGQPIGSDCLRRHPEVKPYAVRVVPS